MLPFFEETNFGWKLAPVKPCKPAVFVCVCPGLETWCSVVCWSGSRVFLVFIKNSQLFFLVFLKVLHESFIQPFIACCSAIIIRLVSWIVFQVPFWHTSFLLRELNVLWIQTMRNLHLSQIKNTYVFIISDTNVLN